MGLLLLVLLEEDEYSAVCCCGILGGTPSLEEDDDCSPHMYNVDLNTLDCNNGAEATASRCDDVTDEEMKC
jgi:hypothetical protein